MQAHLASFAQEVCRRFRLGDGELTVAPMRGSANRLWEFRVGAGHFVVKEFPYYVSDDRRLINLNRAATFERQLWQDGKVVMAEPVMSDGGCMVIEIEGSRGLPVTVRVHHRLSGSSLRPVTLKQAQEAGRVLYVIQESGKTFETGPSGNLTWWGGDPFDVLARLASAGIVSIDQMDAGTATLEESLALIGAAESAPDHWVFSHLDHKPENSLTFDESLAVLDWDECGLCHPRLEATESAFRWAGGGQGKVDSALFAAFLAGYRQAGGRIDDLRPADFGKLVAALIGWFVFMGRRALRDFDDTDQEAAAAAVMTRETIERMILTLQSLEGWSASA